MIQKFTFKEHKPTGRYRSFYKSYWEIKLKKRVCGHIYINNDREYYITFSIKKEKTQQDPCPFKNIRLTARFKTIDETKAFLQRAIEKIMSKYDLYFND